VVRQERKKQTLDEFLVFPAAAGCPSMKRDSNGLCRHVGTVPASLQQWVPQCRIVTTGSTFCNTLDRRWMR